MKNYFRSSSSTSSLEEASGCGQIIITIISAFFLAFGLGNIWRFSNIARSYDLFEFVLPYFIMLILVAWPLLLLEKGLGRLSKGGSLHSSTLLQHPIPVLSCGPLPAFFMCCYYPIIAVWILTYLRSMVLPDMTFFTTPEITNKCSSFLSSYDCLNNELCTWDSDATECFPQQYAIVQNFFDQYVNVSVWDGNALFTNSFIINAYSFFAIFIFAAISVIGGIWFYRLHHILIGFCSGSIFLALFFIFFKNKNALSSISFFLTFDMKKLFDKRIWIAALGQCLFSIGLGHGCLITSVSNKKSKGNLFLFCFVTIVADIFISVVSWIITMPSTKNLVEHFQLSSLNSSINFYSLTFIDYVTSWFFGVWFPTFLLLFFFFIVSLKSISQYFSTVCLSVGNAKLCTENNIKLPAITFIFFILFNLIAVFINNSSTYDLLLLFDQVNCNLLLVFFVLIEVVIVIWFSFNHLVYQRIGKAPVMFHYMTWFIGWALCGILTVFFPLWIALVSAAIVAFGGLGLSVIWSKKRRGNGLTYCQCLTYMTIFNTETLRWVLNAYYCKNSLFKIPVLWTYTIKYITSAILTAFAFSEFYRFTQSYTLMYANKKYSLYTLGFAAYIPVSIVLLVALIVLMVPSIMEFFQPSKSFLFESVLPDDIGVFVERYYILKENDTTAVTSLE